MPTQDSKTNKQTDRNRNKREGVHSTREGNKMVLPQRAESRSRTVCFIIPKENIFLVLKNNVQVIRLRGHRQLLKEIWPTDKHNLKVK